MSSQPCSASSTTGVPSATSRMPGPAATSVGMPLAAAMIATCEVGPRRARADARDAARIERHQLRGQEIVGEKDRRGGNFARGDRRLAAQHAQHLVLEVAQVGGALAHARIVERGERLAHGAVASRQAYPALLPGAQPFGFAREHGILHQLGVRLEKLLAAPLAARESEAR